MSNIDPGPTDDNYMYCPQVTGITVCGIQMLSSVRVLTWEPLTGMLLANPPNDTSLLWNSTLAAESQTELVLRLNNVAPTVNTAHVVKSSGAAMDLTVASVLPVKVDAMAAAPITFTVGVFAPRAHVPMLRARDKALQGARLW